MGLIKTIQMNMRYIRTVNACDLKAYVKFIDEVFQIKGGFTSKRFLWNIIRGKTFYITLANYVVNLVRDVMDGEVTDLDTTMNQVERIIHMVMTTEKDQAVRKSFVQNVTKQVPLVTADMIKYMSYERIQHILEGETILNDDYLQPFIDEIAKLHAKLEDAERTLSDTMDIMLGD